MKYIIKPKDEVIRSEIVIDLFPTQVCNYKCSYCFTDFTNAFIGEHQNVIFNSEKFDILLDNIPHNRNILFHILGGEPTLIPSILDITQRIIDTKNRVCVVTNGSMLYKLQFQDEVHLEVSIHEEYIDDEYIDNMVKGIANNPNCNGIELAINISADFETVKSNIKRVVDSVLELKQSNVCIKLNPIICEDHTDNHEIDYDAVVEYFGIQDDMASGDDSVYILTNTITGVEKEISFLDHIHIYERRNHSFEGCFCITNTYEITNNFDLYNACGSDVKIGNILDDPSLLTNITNQFRLCDSLHCNAGCYMDTTKHFDLDGEL